MAYESEVGTQPAFLTTSLISLQPWPQPACPHLQGSVLDGVSLRPTWGIHPRHPHPREALESHQGVLVVTS